MDLLYAATSTPDRRDDYFRFSLLLLFFFAANVCTAVSRHSFPSFPTNYTPNLQFEIVRLDQIDSDQLESMLR